MHTIIERVKKMQVIIMIQNAAKLFERIFKEKIFLARRKKISKKQKYDNFYTNYLKEIFKVLNIYS